MSKILIQETKSMSERQVDLMSEDLFNQGL